jgi:putative NIF3 family GTP cyclohydrolase 1 type 2
MMKTISRREFVALTTAVPFAVPAVLQSAAAPTAQEVVDRLKQKLGIEWKADGVDTFKAGDPMTPVKGIATSAMATLDVLKQAVKAGANFVITCEPTFYSRSDSAAPSGGRRGVPAAPDPIFTAKNEFIRKNQLVVWRFSDHWRQRIPDPLSIGLADTLGWGKLRAKAQEKDPRRIDISPTTLEALVSDLKKKLDSRGGIRVVGDPKLTVAKIGLLPGTTTVQNALGLFPFVDAIIAGEVREWETVELARDQVTAGERKSLVLLGRVVSENPGMNECAKWLKDVVPEIRTTWIPVDDPYWRPA